MSKKTIRLSDLSPGLRSVVTRFESAVREHDRLLNCGEAFDKEEAADIDRCLDIHKQALLRKLKRMESSDA